MSAGVNIKNKKASFDYEILGYRQSDLVKLDIRNQKGHA